MTPDHAIQSLARVLAAEAPPFSEVAIYAGLEDSGVPAKEADLAYKFAQVACGRRLLDGTGVSFPDEYFCFDRSGEIIESGLLLNQPYFLASKQAVTVEKIGTEAFSGFALMSAEVDAINQALHAGSKPEDLVAAPVFLFLEEPSDAGLAKAQQLMSAQMTRVHAQNRRRKPWWKFW